MHREAYRRGIQGALFPEEYGGTPPEGFDAFHELILWDELARVGGGGALGQLAINSMALPPIIDYGTQYVKDLTIGGLVKGDINVSLAISEPGAGSDVSNIQTTAVRDGEYFVINGSKKWITGGHIAHCAVLTLFLVCPADPSQSRWCPMCVVSGLTELTPILVR